MRSLRTIFAAIAASVALLAAPALGDTQSVGGTYSARDLINAGSSFFGQVSQDLATVVEDAVSHYGLPNGYILGQEGSFAIIAGARYGRGTLYTRNAGQHPLYWQGPSVGVDFGGNGDRVMMLVYNLPSVPAIYDRFVGVAGSAHIVAGFGMTVLARNDVTIVPIITGIGARLGLNIGYLKFTDHETLNPL
jgi:hypothetical protein